MGPDTSVSVRIVSWLGRHFRRGDGPYFVITTIACVIFIFLSFGLFSTACVLPAATTDGGDTFSGAFLLAFGWLGLLSGQLGWLANPALLLSAITLTLRFWLITLGLTVIDLFLAANTLLAFEKRVDIPYGTYGLERLHAGFYFWIGSMVIIGLAAVFFFGVDFVRKWRYRRS